MVHLYRTLHGESNGHVMAAGCPIDSVSGSRIGLSGSADPFNPLALLPAIVLNFLVHFSSGSSGPIYTWFDTGLEVRRHAPVWYTGTSLVGLKSYRHLFLADCHTGIKIAASRCVS